MLTDVKLILAKPIFIIGCAMALMFIKFSVVTAIAKISGNRWPTSIRLGVTLAQGGEFAFVLFSVATAQNVLQPELANTLNLI
ncbi:cation:proton antiporter, partial [Psychrobacter sp. TB55-MNA-CIBAN-0194]